MLPDFLGDRKSAKILTVADLENGFKLTEYFIKKNLNPVKGFQKDHFFRLRNRVLLINKP